MAARVAQEFQEGWLVNLGIGIPTLCSNFAKEVIFHSENGVIGYGPQVAEGEENINMVNAGGQHVSLLPGGSIVHHADAFAIIRAGYLDVSVLGSYEVAENGDFANWKTRGPNPRRSSASGYPALARPPTKAPLGPPAGGPYVIRGSCG